MLMSESKALSNQSLSAMAGIFNSIFNLGGYGVKSRKRPLRKDRPPVKFSRGQKSIGGYTSE